MPGQRMSPYPLHTRPGLVQALSLPGYGVVSILLPASEAACSGSAETQRHIHAGEAVTQSMADSSLRLEWLPPDLFLSAHHPSRPLFNTSHRVPPAHCLPLFLPSDPSYTPSSLWRLSSSHSCLLGVLGLKTNTGTLSLGSPGFSLPGFRFLPCPHALQPPLCQLGLLPHPPPNSRHSESCLPPLLP